MDRKSRGGVRSLGFSLGCVLVAALGSAQSTKLSPTLAREPGASIVRSLFSPDGEWVVFVTLEGETSRTLTSVSSKVGSAPIRLVSDVRLDDFEIDPASSRVVYLAGGVYSTPIDRSAPVQLDGPEVPVTDLPWSSSALRLSADGTRVFYLAREDGGLPELYVAEIDGGSSARKVNDDLVEGGSVKAFVLGPDGAQVAYMADAETLGEVELYVAPADGSGGSVALSGHGAVGGDVVRPLTFDASAERVVYLARPGPLGPAELFSAPGDASTEPVRLNAPIASDGLIFEVQVAGERVVYRARVTGDVRGLFSAPLTGGASAIRIDRPSGRADDPDWLLTPDGAEVVYVSDELTRNRFELFRAPIDASSASVRINQPFSEGFIYAFRLDPSGTRVVFERGSLQNLVLINASLEGLGEFQLTGQDGTPNSSRSLEISADGLRAVYRARLPATGRTELRSVRLDGRSPPRRLSAIGQEVSQFLVGPGERVIYTHLMEDHATFIGSDLYGVAIDGSDLPRRLALPLALGPVIGDVGGFSLSPAGDRVVFTASGHPSHGQDENPSIANEVYSVRDDGSEPAIQLYGRPVHWGFQDVGGVQISADGERVTFRGGSVGGEYFGLFGTSVDEQLASLQISENGPGSQGHVDAFALHPLDGRAVYISKQANSTRELRAAPTDGVGGETSLSGPLVANGRVLQFRIASDGSRAVYVAAQLVADRYELFSVPLDGSAGPLVLQGPLAPGGDVWQVEIAPDGRTALYVADQDTDQLFELYAVPLDGSASPVKLSGPMAPGGGVAFSRVLFTPDSRLVVYAADQETDGVLELYVAPLDASAPAIRLSGPMTAGGGLLASTGLDQAFQISSDGSRVVYLADQDADDVFELYVASTGGGAPRKLNDVLVAGGDVVSTWYPAFWIAPDARSVVYRADQDQDDVFELYVVSLDGSRTSKKLNGFLPPDGDVRPGFQISPDSARAVFVADHRQAGVVELFGVRLDRGPARVLNGPLVDGGDVLNSSGEPRFGISADSSRVVYVADQDTDEVFELYASPLDSAAGRSRARTDEVARDRSPR